MTLNDLKRKFIEVYGGTEEDLRVFTAPGRVNLIGEHTDYNGGYVLPAALTLSSTVIARARKDRNIRLFACGLEAFVDASIDNLDAYRNLKWGNYQIGVAYFLQEAGYRLTGCDLLYYETVPHGAGLSSSAAIEVATAMALATLANEAHGVSVDIDRKELALISQRAENHYVGVNCGIMDQFASSMGKKNHAILLDCKSLEYRLVPLRLDGLKLLITNTNKARSLADSKYNERRSECEKGLDLLKSALPEVTCLCDVSCEQFIRFGSLIKDDVIRKRAEHIIYENNRVIKSAEALSSNDMITFGRLMTESHQSLKNLYEVTGTELDTLVEEAHRIEGVLGSRMTGAGFGGCTVTILKEGAVERFINQVGSNYYSKTGLKADFYISETDDGVRELDIL
jgi:galactokinase